MRRIWSGWQSPLAAGIEQFLAYKRALGRRFHVEENALRLLDRYIAERGIDQIEKITPELLEAFLLSRPRPSPRSYNHLLGTISRLFGWMVQQGLVVGTLLRAKPRRQTTQQKPFLFDLPLFRKLLELVEGMPDNPRVKMRRQTYRMLFVLLYGLGLRVGESCRLCCKDVDLIRRLLIIRKTKFAKDRLIPFGPRIGAALRNYLEVREKTYGPLSPESPVFCFTKDRPINPDTITLTFHQLILRLKLVAPPGHASPHLHHLRHSFAVGTLLRWYRTGIDPQTRLIQLSTFLGHANPASSAVYLTITDNLLVEANKRFEQFARVALEIEE